MTDLPTDHDAERFLLGCVLHWPAQIVTIGATLRPADFAVTSRSVLFETMLALHAAGRLIGDPVPAIVGELERQHIEVPNRADLHSLRNDAYGTEGPALMEYIRRVLRASVARKLAFVAGDIRDLALDAELDAPELLDRAAEMLAGLDVPKDRARDLMTMSEFIRQTSSDHAEWVVPGLLRRGWRAVIVGAEGVGKAVTLRQLAGASAQGIHPFTLDPIPPIRTLLIDTENPRDAIVETAGPIEAQARRVAGEHFDEGRQHIWFRPGGIDIRKRADRMELEATIGEVRPDLICAGPLYKLYAVSAKESDEQAAREAQGIIDDLRARYSFAAAIEHHAPKASGGVRDILPYGSSLWLRWPELGIALRDKVADLPPGALAVGRWRRDRVKCSWPDQLHRGEGWPWVGKWRNPVVAR